jgi:hypothetical protein
VNEDDEKLEQCLRRWTDLLRSVNAEATSTYVGPVDSKDAALLLVVVEGITKLRAERARVEHALGDALDRVEHFEAQAAEHWLRLASCRGVLCDPDATDEERQEVLTATATDDAPALDAIDRARARISFPRA